MLFAYTEEKKLIAASEQIDEKNCFCPDCGESVIRKAGKIKIPHFAHTSGTNCFGLSEGETQEHLQLKQLFLDWGEHFECGWKMEEPLTDLAQRPDLLRENLAVEIQCSVINGSRLAERINGYNQKGYQNWWLLGQKLWPADRLTHLQRQFCSFDQVKGIHLWLLEKDQLRLLYHIYEGEQFVYREACRPSYSQSLSEIFQSSVFERPLPLLPTIEKRNNWKLALSMKLVQRNPKIRGLQHYFYQEHRHLLFLPEWMYFPSRYFFFYQEDLLVFRYLFQKEAKNASLIFQKFLAYRAENQKEWVFHQVDQQEILERLYLEAIFCQRKAKISAIR